MPDGDNVVVGHGIVSLARLPLDHLAELARDIVGLGGVTRVAIAGSEHLDHRQDLGTINENVLFKDTSSHAIIFRLRVKGREA